MTWCGQMSWLKLYGFWLITTTLNLRLYCSNGVTILQIQLEGENVDPRLGFECFSMAWFWLFGNKITVVELHFWIKVGRRTWFQRPWLQQPGTSAKHPHVYVSLADDDFLLLYKKCKAPHFDLMLSFNVQTLPESVHRINWVICVFFDD